MKVSAYVKTIVAALVAAGSVATVALGDDVLTPTELVNVALAILGAFGVYVMPNAAEGDDRTPTAPAAPTVLMDRTPRA